VAADERKAVLRADPHYGHTLGHGVETLCGLWNVLHGEAGWPWACWPPGDLAVAMGPLDRPTTRPRTCL